MLAQNLNLVESNILESKSDVIFHQCNCESTYAKGLALDINKKFPYADIYKNDVKREPGSVIICSPDKESKSSEPHIACLLAQYNRGKPNKYGTDTYNDRKKWFASALNDFVKKSSNLKIKTLAFPYKIGCGLAGGTWDDYLTMINDFALANKEYEITIYKI